MHMKKELINEWVCRYDFKTKDNDKLGRTIWKTYNTLSKIRNIKSTSTNYSFFKDLEEDLDKVVQNLKQMWMSQLIKNKDRVVSTLRLTRASLKKYEAKKAKAQNEVAKIEVV